jgi:rubredoxin
MEPNRTHLILTCQHCGKILDLPVANPKAGDKLPPSGLDDARQAAAEQGWLHEDERWTCPDCQPALDPADETEEAANT